MLDIDVKMDINTLKQVLLYGILLVIVIGIAEENISSRFPSYGNIEVYFAWIITFILKAILFAFISIIFLKASYLVLKIIKR